MQHWAKYSLWICLLACSACAPAPTKPVAVPAEHLENVFRIHEKVFSGSEPEGPESFAEIASWGVKTIISVDGERPDLEDAHKYGLRYVHLPHGYDGIPERRGQELAKAVRDLPGPIYIHCHHGKQRAPTAAAVACVSLGLVTPESAELILKTCNTSEHYLGLYASAKSARAVPTKVLDALPADFPEVAEIPKVTDAMVRVNHLFDAVAASVGRDVEAPHRALLLKEELAELARMNEVREKSPTFQKMLKDSIAAAESLEDTLASEHPPGSFRDAVLRVQRSCNDCHSVFRDLPRTP